MLKVVLLDFAGGFKRVGQLALEYVREAVTRQL